MHLSTYAQVQTWIWSAGNHNDQRLGADATARLAQSAERKALNLVVVGSSPTVGVFS